MKLSRTTTVRWTGMDDLAHVVARDHTRWCDGAAVAGLNHSAAYLTCFVCIACLNGTMPRAVSVRALSK